MFAEILSIDDEKGDRTTTVHNLSSTVEALTSPVHGQTRRDPRDHHTKSVAPVGEGGAPNQHAGGATFHTPAKIEAAREHPGVPRDQTGQSSSHSDQTRDQTGQISSHSQPHPPHPHGGVLRPAPPSARRTGSPRTLTSPGHGQTRTVTGTPTPARTPGSHVAFSVAASDAPSGSSHGWATGIEEAHAGGLPGSGVEPTGASRGASQATDRSVTGATSGRLGSGTGSLGKKKSFWMSKGGGPGVNEDHLLATRAFLTIEVVQRIVDDGRTASITSATQANASLLECVSEFKWHFGTDPAWEEGDQADQVRRSFEAAGAVNSVIAARKYHLHHPVPDKVLAPGGGITPRAIGLDWGAVITFAPQEVPPPLLDRTPRAPRAPQAPQPPSASFHTPRAAAPGSRQ
ncbi:hypothetical protein T484DRAFT_1895641, partial [Baffinella frigidus]